MSIKKNNPEKDSQEYIDTLNNAHIITTRTLRYIQQKIINRLFSEEEYDKHYQDILAQNSKILNIY